jgi:hypothetical protein
MRRLTRFEYENTVRDLLGLDVQVGRLLPDDVTGKEHYDNFPTLQSASELHGEKYEAAARELAVRFAAEGHLGCDPAAVGEEACGCQFAARFARRAYRGPVPAEDETRLCSFLKAQRKEFGFKDAIEQVVTVILQSPRFLYRIEGPTLTAHDRATRLSYLLTGSMPDEALAQAADRGELTTPTQVRAQAERLLADPRARVTAQRFFELWLGLTKLSGVEKDKQAYPRYDDALPALWRRETATFLEEATFGANADKGLQQLFDGAYTFANKTLAQFYGLPTVPASTSRFEQVPVPAGQRAGVLSHGSFLATHAHHNQTSPIMRGLAVRETLFCHEIAPPPDVAEIQIPEPGKGLTTRQRFDMHSSAPACAACHSLIDKIGVGFEGFDGIGVLRDKEEGHTIDTRGELLATDVDGSFAGFGELSARLARSAQVRACFVENLYKYAFARSLDRADRCALEGLVKDLGPGSFKIRDVLLGLTQTPTFLSRGPLIKETP